MDDLNHCCVCNEPLGDDDLGTAWLCHGCAYEHDLIGIAFQHWPSWIKSLVYTEMARREYRDEGDGDRVLASESPYVDNLFYSACEDVDGTRGDPANAPLDPLTDDLYAEPLMLYAPYQNEARNREYRAASNIHRTGHKRKVAVGPVAMGEYTLMLSRGFR